jgi:Flp pilus assembly pilin Flp
MLRGGVLILFNKIKTVLSNEKGSTFIESGLWIALVVLVMAGAGVAHSMLGELTPSIATAVSRSKALKMLLPIGKNKVEIVGVQKEPLPHLIDMLIDNLKKFREVD